MSVEVLSAPRGESDKDVQNKKVSQSEADILAQYSKELDFDADAIEAEEKQKAIEAQQLTKLAELNEHLEDAEDRRRGLKAIYNSDLADSMSNEEVEAFIAERLAPAELETPVAPEVEKTAEKSTGAPDGFPTREEYLEDQESEGPVKIGFWKKARLLAGAPGRAVWKGYSKLFESAAKRSDKYNAMTPEQQERLKKKTAIISTLSALAIGGAYFATKSEQIRDLLPGHEVKGHAVPAGTVEISDPKEHQGGESAVNTLAEQQRVHEAQFIYSPEADPFNNPDKKEWNFGAALDTSSVEAATADLTEGWKHNPLQFATVMGSFGMIPNDQASIEGMARQMLDSPSLYATNHAAAMDIVNSSNAHFVEGSYNAHGSYSMVANPNGDQSLIYDPSVVDSQMMLVMNTPNGPVATGCNCRQISEIPAAPISYATGGGTTQPQSYGAWQPRQNQELPTGGGTTPYTPSTPNNPNTPQTPEIPDVPEVPHVPEIPHVPEVPHIPEVPNDAKDYSGGVGTAPGIDPNLNRFIEDTIDPLIRGNGTQSPNLDPAPAPGSQMNNHISTGAAPNSAPQVTHQESGAGTSRTQEDAAERAQQAAAQREQDAANKAAKAAEKAMDSAGAVDSAVREAQAGMDANGRPN